jgi:hypothetical protein
MKKMILIAATVILTSVGIGFAASSLHRIADHSKCGIGQKCSHCGGTGFRPGSNQQCAWCSGSGKDGAY